MPSRDHLVLLLGRTLASQKIVVNRTGMLLIDGYLWPYGDVLKLAASERDLLVCVNSLVQAQVDCAILTSLLNLAALKVNYTCSMKF